MYETFGEFLGDCLTLEPNPPNIDLFWDTYYWHLPYAEHFIQEDYSQGVAIWSWPHLENWIRDPYFLYMAREKRKPRYYQCCNPADSHLIGYLPGEYRNAIFPPAVPRETTTEVAITPVWTIP